MHMHDYRGRSKCVIDMKASSAAELILLKPLCAKSCHESLKAVYVHRHIFPCTDDVETSYGTTIFGLHISERIMCIIN